MSDIPLEKLQAFILNTSTQNFDIETVNQALLLEAERRLDAADVVIGPSLDGGYYLIGMKVAHEALFDRIAWSTDSVYGVTMSRIRDLALSVAVLEAREDIDDLQSLRSQREFIDPDVWAEIGIE